MSVDAARPLLLFVDDERALSEVYREICEDEGWDCVVWTAPGNPTDVAALGPSLIVTDLVFAADREAGQHFIASLAGHPATAGIPVVVCSADEQQLEDVSALPIPSVCGQSAKPFDVDALVAEIRRCFTRADQPGCDIQPVAH